MLIHLFEKKIFLLCLNGIFRLVSFSQAFLSLSSDIHGLSVDTDRHLTPQSTGGATKEEAQLSFVVQPLQAEVRRDTGWA